MGEALKLMARVRQKGQLMGWASDPVQLDDNVPLPAGTYTANIDPLPLPQGQVRVSNFRPCQQYKTWGSQDHAEIALGYLRKHETEGWKFRIEPAPTFGRFVIAATDGWGKDQGWI